MTQAAPNVQIESDAAQRSPEPTLVTGHAPEDPIFQILKIARRRFRAWLIFVPIAFAALLIYSMVRAPQSSSATVSLSIQQSGMNAGSALSALAGGGANKRYIGIIESRRLAEKVADRISLTSLYPRRSADSVIDMLKGAASVGERHNDGLVYIDVKLSEPPLLARHASATRRKIRQACADAANAYAAELQQYYSDTDNDKDTLLLREAEDEMRRARADFDAASAQMADFVGHAESSRTAPASLSETPAAGGGGADGIKGSPSGLPALYAALAQTETEIRSVDAARTVQNRMVAGQLHDLSALPDEDPLLREARGRYNEALTELQSLKVQFGPMHPRVIAARAQLRIAEEMLRQKMAGVQGKRTTEDVRSAATLASLSAKRDSLQRQIAVEETRFRLTRQTTVRFEQLRNEVMLRLEVLKTVGSEAARLRLMTVSAKNRVVVVDVARVPKSSQPGLSRMALTDLALALFCLAAWIGVEYGMQMLRDWKAATASGGPVQIRVEQA